MNLGIYEEADTYKVHTLELLIKEMGNKNADKFIYYIEAGTEISGLCALLRRTLSGLYIADMLNAVPVVSWQKSALLNEHRSINGSDNPFEYFFQPISSISREEVFESRWVIEHEIKYDAYLWAESRLSSSDGQTKRYLALQQNTLKKYPIKLKETVEKQIQKDIAKLIGGSRILGVHIRGAQRRRRITGLANPIPLEWYFDEIDKVLTENQYDKIFIATDDDEYLEKMEERYGDRILCFRDTRRSKGGFIPYFSADSPKYRVTYEVLRDIYTLIACNALIGGPSNVTTMARVLKTDYGEWEQCIMLDNGLCEDGEANIENTLKIIQNNGNMSVLNQ